MIRRHAIGLSITGTNVNVKRVVHDTGDLIFVRRFNEPNAVFCKRAVAYFKSCSIRINLFGFTIEEIIRSKNELNNFGLSAKFAPLPYILFGSEHKQ